jgi:hypothetical protein
VKRHYQKERLDYRAARVVVVAISIAVIILGASIALGYIG